jgi:NAD(P)-dependent dehydrogenase (short-subunit alcohol dehydrogenase family)
VMDEFDSIDILVNNAGAVARAPLLEHSEQDWDRVVDTNLKGYYLCSRAVGKIMAEQKKGNIINISSVRGIAAAPGGASYCVSKAAVLMLTRVLALELVDYNIRVNAIAPGWVKTNLNKVLLSDPKVYKEITAKLPMGRWVELSEIARVALFLASDASSYITGHTIVVDGGLIA